MAKEVDYTILFAGVTGSGKSEAGNFFMNNKVFLSKLSLRPVTTAPVCSVSNVGGKFIKIIDTPGFLDPCSLTSSEEFKDLAKAIIAMSDGINAIGFFINLQNRITKEDKNLLEKLLAMQNMIPYTFLIFTHAGAFGEKEEQQQIRIKEILKDTKECPEILQKVLSSINNRYILLESVKPMGEDYYDRKSNELLCILQEIKDQNNSSFSPIMQDVTKQLEKFDEQNKEKSLLKLLENAKLELSKQSKNEPNLFWGILNTFIRDSSKELTSSCVSAFANAFHSNSSTNTTELGNSSGPVARAFSTLVSGNRHNNSPFSHSANLWPSSPDPLPLRPPNFASQLLSLSGSSNQWPYESFMNNSPSSQSSFVPLNFNDPTSLPSLSHKFPFYRK